jgi:hypothetical protein
MSGRQEYLSYVFIKGKHIGDNAWLLDLAMESNGEKLFKMLSKSGIKYAWPVIPFNDEKSKSD